MKKPFFIALILSIAAKKMIGGCAYGNKILKVRFNIVSLIRCMVQRIK